MPGLSDLSALNYLNHLTGQLAASALPSVWLGLYTIMPTSDAGSGGTEVSGTGYARVQVAGPATTNGATASGNAVLHFASTPAWITAGMSVRDATSAAVIPAATTVLSTAGTTVTMSANATGGGVGNGDSVVFSAFTPAIAAVGTEPSVVPAYATTGAIVTFATAGAGGWGTAVGFGLFDAVSSGALLGFDHLGAYSWLPATMSTASPGVISAHAHGYSAADTVVVTAKYGGTVPTFSQSNLTGLLAVVSPTTDSFTVTNGGTAVNTSGTGDFSVRKVASQSIPANVTASFAAGQLTLNLA